MFSGRVPASLCSFRSLRFLNISGNSFLEDSMPTMNKSELLSTENNILVPKRYILAESNSTTNEGFNSDNPQPPTPSPTYELNHKHNKKKRVIRWILEFSFGTLAVIICGTFFIGKKNDTSVAIFSLLIEPEDLAFLEKGDAVASLQIIGKGGCGEVYKAELQKSKVKAIAIKKVLQPPKDTAELTEEDTKFLHKKMQQIRSEIQTIGQIRYPNLLPLLAHVSRPSGHYLVYEFMKNGSLQDILQEVKDGSRELDWLARHRIALGVATGLEHLHMDHTPRIFHRDLKPANVLLNDNMEALITDFGLAVSIPEADTYVETFNVAGTLGYMAPEHYETMEYTDKCDIYSFGVLLAVLVMGKLPSDDFFRNTYEMGLVIWMRNLLTREDPKNYSIRN